jgi:hypothetical protein
MLKLLRAIFELIFLAIAISIGFPHGQQIWYNHASVGVRQAIAQEWEKAGILMLVSIIIVAVVIIIEVVFVILEKREQRKKEKKDNQRWDVIFHRLGINTDKGIGDINNDAQINEKSKE